MPPPLQIPPSRARRQFAARLAQRKAELEASQKGDDDDDDDDDAVLTSKARVEGGDEGEEGSDEGTALV
jgi:SIT4-associating protein SAP185/190